MFIPKVFYQHNDTKPTMWLFRQPYLALQEADFTS